MIAKRFAFVSLLSNARCFLPGTYVARYPYSASSVVAAKADSTEPTGSIERSNDATPFIRNSALRPWSPMRRFSEIFDAFEREFFDEGFGRMSPFTQDLSSPSTRPVSPWMAPTMGQLDISETEKLMKVSIDLPGIKKEDVNIELDNGYLTISAERKEEFEENSRDMKRQERSFGMVKRVIQIPDYVDQDSADLNASFNDGVLHIDLPKLATKASKAPKQLKIQ